jgi:hypothetical protein
MPLIVADIVDFPIREFPINTIPYLYLMWLF